MEKEKMSAKFQKLKIAVEGEALLPGQVWMQIYDSLNRFYTDYPEVPAGRLGRIQVDNSKLKYLYSLGFPMDETSVDIGAGMVLTLNRERFADPTLLWNIMKERGIKAESEQAVSRVMEQVLGYVLEMNDRILRGELDGQTESRENYDRVISSQTSENNT